MYADISILCVEYFYILLVISSRSLINIYLLNFYIVPQKVFILYYIKYIFVFDSGHVCKCYVHWIAFQIQFPSFFLLPHTNRIFILYIYKYIAEINRYFGGWWLGKNISGYDKVNHLKMRRFEDDKWLIVKKKIMAHLLIFFDWCLIEKVEHNMCCSLFNL